jgi:hypothetical protein
MTGARPVRRAKAAVLRARPQLAPRLEKLMWRVVYEVASMGRGDSWPMVMNYGYAALDATEAELGPMDDRFRLQLYEKVAGATDP